MSSIFKYSTYDVALEIIENNSVLLNNPETYNDPFDSIIEFNKKDEDKVIELLIEIAFVKFAYELCYKKTLKFKWFLKPIIWLDKLILSLEFRFAKKNHYYFSDPLIKIISKTILKSAKNQNFDALKSFENEKYKLLNEQLPEIKNIRKKALISCFSKCNDSILMWGHYGEKHKGVCIEFERPKYNFYDVKYRNKRQNFPLYDITCIISSYLLNNEKIPENNYDLINKGLSSLLSKAKCWSYEKEVRCIFANNNANFKNDQFYKMPTKIKGIYLGCKISKENKANILEILKEKDIPVYQFTESKNSYKLLLKQIKNT